MLSGTVTTRSRPRALGPQAVPSDRRRRSRLRDLCDEVLASHRAATERDVITEVDRIDARMILARVAPIGLRK